MEHSVQFNSKGYQLEGRYADAQSQKAVIVTHPHPLYGGSMDNPVVETIVQAYRENGYTSLRFNFRGTGQSQGAFDDGQGEQDDVLAAIEKLKTDGYQNIDLAGYSFGARINAQVISSKNDITDHVMVSPPVAFMSFDDIAVLPSTGLIVSGDQDEYAPVSLIKDHIQRWKISPEYEIIQNCDHFYSTGLGRLKEIIGGYLSSK